MGRLGALALYPGLPELSDIPVLLLGRMQRLFFSVKPRRASVLCIALMLIRTPQTTWAHSHRA